MRIVVWGINYAPELTGIAVYNTALCEDLRERGHDVSMLTSFCYYPAWRKLPEDRGRLVRTDVVRGVPVHRCWHYVPRRVSTLRRIVHEASFVLVSLLRLFLLKRPDVLVVVSPPLLLGVAAWCHRLLRGTPFVFHVQDLQPDAAVGLGMLKPSLFVRALYRLEALAYRQAARVTGISQGMLRAFERKGVPAAKCGWFPNGVVVPAADGLPPRGRFRARHGLEEGDVVALYSGNLGVKQGLEVLLEAAPLLAESSVRIVICGAGARGEFLAEAIRSRRLGNVHLLPLQPEAEYVEMLVDADVCLITQQAGAGAAFFPSKLLAALAHARPVLAVADETSELSRAVTEGRFGVCVPPGQPEAVAVALRDMAGNPERLAAWGASGREFVRQFEFQTVHAVMAGILEGVVARGR